MKKNQQNKNPHENEVIRRGTHRRIDRLAIFSFLESKLKKWATFTYAGYEIKITIK
jgi:hypothetical protein